MTTSRRHDRRMRGRIPRSRSAFTLVEMLVVITILLVMMGVTVAVINVSAEGERIRSGASQVQSYLAGARDRAAFAGRPCGVRLFLDPLGSEDINGNSQLDNGEDANGNNLLDLGHLVTSMVYIQVPDDWQQGSFTVTSHQGDASSSLLIEDVKFNGVLDPGEDSDGDGQLDSGEDTLTGTTDWRSIDLLLNTNLLRKPRIMIQGHWYTVWAKGDWTYQNNGPVHRYLAIRPRFRGSMGEDFNNNGVLDQGEDINGNGELDQGTRVGEGEYRLRLQPAVMPGQEPVLLPAGVAVDLDQCRRRHDAAFAETLPKSWYPANTYLPALDILFSPNGTVVGPEASKGVIHLLVNDVADSTQKLFPIDLPGAAALNQSDKRVVSLFTRTGYVTTSEIVSLPEYLGTKNQFYYAERGETE